MRWSQALPLIQLLVFASAYLGIATRLTRLVLSHLERRIVALIRGSWSACRYHPDNSALRLELPDNGVSIMTFGIECQQLISPLYLLGLLAI